MIEKMRKNILGSVAIAAVAALSLASCNKSQPQVEAKSESKAPAELKIAYVEVDSIMTQYTFAKEYSSILEKKGQNIQATIAQKGQQLQAAAANFQQKIQQNAYTREQAEAIQAGLQKQNNDLQGLQQRLSNEFAAEHSKPILRAIKRNKLHQHSIGLTLEGRVILIFGRTHSVINKSG